MHEYVHTRRLFLCNYTLRLQIHTHDYTKDAHTYMGFSLRKRDAREEEGEGTTKSNPS